MLSNEALVPDVLLRAAVRSLHILSNSDSDSGLKISTPTPTILLYLAGSLIAILLHLAGSLVLDSN